jgi:hypothetical protein
LSEFVAAETIIRSTYKVRGINNILLVNRILKICRGYKRLTVRQAFYILTSRYSKDYPASMAFYKRLNRYLSKIRRVNPEVHQRFVDPTRTFSVPPIPFSVVEIWVEKESIKNFIGPLLLKYHLSIQVLRGFASLSMFRKALARARKRKVKSIGYIGDFGPSGLLIEKVAASEMDYKEAISFHRIAITLSQIKRLRPPSRPVSLKDTRAKAYIEKFGDRRWDVESIRPRTLYKLIEEGFRKIVPPEFLVEAEEREKAARVVRRVSEKMRKAMEREALQMLREGISEEEIRKIIAKKYGR